MNGAEFIVRELIKNGCETVFGYPGGTVLSLYDSLYRHRTEIKHVRTSHEQGSAHAADGYSRITGRPGVCLATSGPGATNLVTGIANAFMDSVPVVFITGNVEHSLIGTDSFQEVDIIGMTLGITKHSWAARDPETLIDAMTHAFNVCMSGRRGPVLIDVAKDVLEGEWPGYQDALGAEVRQIQNRQNVDPKEVENVCSIIDKARKPLIICGGGIRQSGAEEELIMLARLTGSCVCHTLMGIGTVPGSDPYDLGLIGIMAGKDAKAAIEECDLIISAGARLGNRVIDIGGLVERGKKLVQIDADRAEINKIAKADGYITADAKAALKAILAHFKGIPERDPWFSPKKTPDDVDAAFPAPPKMKKGQIRPEDIFKTVKETLGDGITVVTDVGLHQLYTAKYYPLSPADNFITSGGLGTMGFGLGASIGASTARPGRTTVLFTGDGGFMMDMNELATVSYEKLPLIVIVMRNGELGMVREMQRIHCARRYSQTKLDQKLNIPKLCSAFGLKGVRAGSTEALKRALNDALSEKRAVIIEVRTVLRSVENA